VAGISYEILKLTMHPRWGGFFIKLMTPGCGCNASLLFSRMTHSWKYPVLLCAL
jgi:hypothetical protein